MAENQHAAERPWPLIESLGVIGDRRTAALVGRDGSMNWLCLPRFDGCPIFGALIHPDSGGFWRLDPAAGADGSQRYIDASATLVTRWEAASGILELSDLMLWPWDGREADNGGEDARAIIRRLRCLDGEVTCLHHLDARDIFDGGLRASFEDERDVDLEFAGGEYRLWSDGQMSLGAHGARETFTLRSGEGRVAVLASLGAGPWTVARTEAETERTIQYWHDWTTKLDCKGARADRLRRTASTVHLLSYAPTGSPVAAPTTSLPERIGGDLNWDYRYSWVRDASLSVAMLSRLGDIESARRYMDCLATYRSSTDMPLQIVYGIDGELDLPVEKFSELQGYRDSRPVRAGNRACGQFQLDSMGFFNECTLVYLEEGGEWDDELWEMVKRVADFTAEHWRRPDSGIWELKVERQFVSGKMMAWVALDRAVKIAGHGDRSDQTDHWRQTMDVIRQDILEHGWSEEGQTFTQVYGGVGLDASVLLGGISGFLPADDPRMQATARAIEDRLTVNGFVHRFDPSALDDIDDLAVGEYEGAFLPCTFWLITLYAMGGRTDEAEALLLNVEALAGDLGLFAEEVDAESGAFLGNAPLLFSQVEYARAVIALDAARTT